MKLFIAGAVAGAVAAFIWRDEIARYLDASTRDFRARTADTLEHAEKLVEAATGKIGGTIHAGQEAIRPTRMDHAAAR